jgi:MSHA biogenesis protein MshK
MTVLTALLIVPASALSQGMTDPTRPPTGFGAGDPEVEGPTGGPVLQSVKISPAGRSAIISGEVVRLGQKYGDAVLIKVAENEVVLKSGDGTQVLKMYPGVEKRDMAPAAAKTPPRRSKGRKAADPAAAGTGGPR